MEGEILVAKANKLANWFNAGVRLREFKKLVFDLKQERRKARNKTVFGYFLLLESSGKVEKNFSPTHYRRCFAAAPFEWRSQGILFMLRNKWKHLKASFMKLCAAVKRTFSQKINTHSNREEHKKTETRIADYACLLNDSCASLPSFHILGRIHYKTFWQSFHISLFS